MLTTQPSLPSAVLNRTGASAGLRAGSVTLTDLPRSIFNSFATPATARGSFGGTGGAPARAPPFCPPV
jgi:hypothetical protein